MMYNNLLLKSENGRHSKTWKSCKGGKFSRLQLESFALCRVMVTLTYVICRLACYKNAIFIASVWSSPNCSGYRFLHQLHLSDITIWSELRF